MKYFNIIINLLLWTLVVHGEKIKSSNEEIPSEFISFFETDEEKLSYYNVGIGAYKLFHDIISSYENDIKTFSLKECEAKCLKAQNEFASINESNNTFYNIDEENLIRKLYNLPDLTISSGYDRCVTSCQYLEIIYQNLDKAEPFFISDNKNTPKNKRRSSLEKRDITCSSIEDKGKDEYGAHTFIITVDNESSAKNGLYSRINGCTLPSNIKTSSTLQNISKDIFESACNYHDACYHCSEDNTYAKSQCDSNFKQFMYGICDTSKKLGLFSEYEGCVEDADLMHLVVVNYDNGVFHDDHNFINSLKNSAKDDAICICTERDVQTLLTYPFHLKIITGTPSGNSESNNKGNSKSKKISTDGRCGPDFGDTSCPSGRCCSKYGFCGTSADHCNQNCLQEYGSCTGNGDANSNIIASYSIPNIPISTNGRCGVINGGTACPPGQCCSKYGYCGNTSIYCNMGCQSEYGYCSHITDTAKPVITITSVNSSNLNITTDGRCGANIGICPSGQCCSKYGFCGSTSTHCNLGCQPKYGHCTNSSNNFNTNSDNFSKISTNGRCGKDYGICPDNECCSEYGFCGTTSLFCGKGCQSKYGKCL